MDYLVSLNHLSFMFLDWTGFGNRSIWRKPVYKRFIVACSKKGLRFQTQVNVWTMLCGCCDNVLHVTAWTSFNDPKTCN